MTRLVFQLLCSVALSIPWVGCASAGGVDIGMTAEEVVTRLGEPDRKAVLDGKLLRDVTALEPGTDLSQYRLMFSYEADAVQVWFENGLVSGMTKDGISVLDRAGGGR